jgi:TldD protein
VYRGRIGSQIASPLLDVSDDGTMAHGWGSSAVDDEGTPSRKTVLVDHGVLRSYLGDRATATRFGGTSTANSRRASYTDLPYVRMTNTVVGAGDTDPGDIVGETTSGIYVAHLRGGSFNPGSGDFVFSTSEAWLIENGEITTPISNATIIGSAGDALLRIDAVGNDFEMVAGGRCGKRNQTIPVGFGSPTIRIRALTIGGH